MGLEGLTQFEIIQGFVGLTTIAITTFVGLKILSKYFSNKKIEFLTVGLMMIFVNSAWWGSSVAFFLYVFFSYELSDVAYFFISYGLVILTSIFWYYSFGYLVYPKSKWKIVSIWLAISIVYIIFFMYYLFINPSLLAVRVTRFDTETRTFVSGYVLLSLLSSLITQFIFFRKSVASEDKRIKWKGRFIFIGYILFFIGGILDSVIPLNPLTLFLTRILLVASSIISYIGWTMPDRVAEWLVKE